MSNVSFRDSSIVIIDTSRTLIRAGLGLGDLLRTPSVVRNSYVRMKYIERGEQTRNSPRAWVFARE